jgi:Mg2+ and Co2+ transporter CorA
MDTNLLLAAVRQYDGMKKLAGWAAILALPTAVFGLHGMNFPGHARVELAYGYPAVMGAVACSGRPCSLTSAGVGVPIPSQNLKLRLPRARFHRGERR